MIAASRCLPFVLSAVLVLLTLPVQAADFKVGSDITIDDKTDVYDIYANPEDYKDREVRLEGTVTKVCQGSGCWFGLKDGEYEIVIKDTSHKLLVPKDCAGSHAVVQGKVVVLPPKDDAPKEKVCSGHDHGEDHGDELDEESAEKPHVCPNPDIQIRTAGVVLSDS